LLSDTKGENMTRTPTVIQIFSKSGNLLASCVVEYDHIDEALKLIEHRLDLLGYTYKVVVPHTLESLQSWLVREISIKAEITSRPITNISRIDPIGPL